MRISNGIQNRNRRMRNRTYGGVRGRKTKVGRKLLRFPPTRFLFKFSYRIFIQQEIKYVHKFDAVIVLVFLDEVACYHILHKTIVYT